jgi:NAD(P)-dependent dehydrogenase (short-subunit alcohol dehydrogenase family)
VESAVADVTRHFGHIDLLVNNAGTVKTGTTSTDEFEAVMSGAFWATVYPVLSVLPGMVNRRSGRIVVVPASVDTLALRTAGCAVKEFTQGLKAQVAESGVTVVTAADRSPAQMVGAMKRDETEKSWSLPNIDLITPAKIRAAMAFGRFVVRQFA